MMDDKTSSHIPKDKKEDRMWIQARRLVAKEEGSSKEKEMPWELVTKIYKNEKKAGKTISDKEIDKTHAYRTVRDYRKPDKKK